MKIGSKLAIIVFSIVAVAHLMRLLLDINLTIGNWIAPLWVSGLGVVGPGLIAWLLWRESK
jgi:hypothetical protein